MLFEKSKDYKLSYKKYEQYCQENKILIIPEDNWAKKYNGARVIIKDDLTEGLIHVAVPSENVFIVNGRPMQQKEEDARLVMPEWCEER